MNYKQCKVYSLLFIISEISVLVLLLADLSHCGINYNYCDMITVSTYVIYLQIFTKKPSALRSTRTLARMPLTTSSTAVEVEEEKSLTMMFKEAVMRDQ